MVLHCLPKVECSKMSFVCWNLILNHTAPGRNVQNLILFPILNERAKARLIETFTPLVGSP